LSDGLEVGGNENTEIKMERKKENENGKEKGKLRQTKRKQFQPLK
jgi:hypothetical protein